MKLKQLVLYYYYSFLLLNILVGMVFGYVTRDVIQPGLFIHGIMLLLLIGFYLKERKNKLGGKVSIMIIGFTIVFFVNLLVVEIVQLNVHNIYPSLNYALKIYLFLFLSYFTINHYEYFKKRINTILLVNVIIILLNIILGYLFKIGGQSYGRILQDSYRGYLAANDTSAFSFVAFGYSLYSFSTSKGRMKKFYFILLIASLYAMYIIATKAFFVAGIILVLFLYQKKRIPIVGLFIVAAVFFLLIIVFKDSSPILIRVFKNYDNSIAQSNRLIEHTDLASPYIRFLIYVAPGRIVIAVLMLMSLLKSGIINILFGFGPSGIYSVFGRPPMMDFFNIIGYFGIIGFVIFYLPQLKLFLKVIKFSQFNMVEVLFFSIFLYGSLGGFLFGVADASIMYSLLFSITYVNLSKMKRIK